MKSILLLLVCCLIVRNGLSQDIKISHSDVTYFNDTITYELKDQLPDGIYKVYYNQQKTVLEYSGELSNHKRINKWSWFYETGKKKTEISYVDGLIYGQYISYYPTEQQEVLIPYVVGNRVGSSMGWYPTGIKLFEGSYANGKPIGIWKFYNEDGTLHNENQY